MNKFTSAVTPIIAATFIIAVPAMAQVPFTCQKEVGLVHQKEACLAGQVQRAFNKGLIDPFELAQMQRDLDGIRTEDDYYRIDTTNGRRAAPVLKKLDQMEANLIAHEANNLGLDVQIANR